MVQKYKILAVSSGGLKGLSGINANLFKTLSKKHEVVGIIDNKFSGISRYYNILNAFLKTSGYSKYLHPLREIYGGNVSYYTYRTKYYLFKRHKMFKKQLKSFDDHDYDLILQTTWMPPIIEKPRNVRCVFTSFTTKMSENEYPQWARFLDESNRNLYVEYETKTFNNASCIFTTSEYTKKAIIRDYNVDAEKIFVVYNGINIKEVSGNTKKKYNKTILFVGFDFERKGGPTLIRAFEILKNTMPDAKLIIVGANPDISMPDVEIMGSLSHPDVVELYQKCSVFAMPSLSEPFGIVFLEAMANQLPCIGCNVNAMPEIIEDGKTGFLIEPNNHEQLAEKLIVLLEDDNLMKIMGEAGRRKVELFFTWDKVVERMTAGFDKIC